MRRVKPIVYRSTPTLERFHRSAAFVRGVMGPVGSGKSSAMCMEIIAKARAQRPGPDGVRRTRFAIIRNTYPELRSTTIKTWRDWAPDALCRLSGQGPVEGIFCHTLPDGSKMRMETLFLALDRPDDVKKLLSLDLTGAWINVAREVPKEVVDAVTARLGRYPAKRIGGPDWSGLIMDTNPPDDDHWWYVCAEVERPERWEFFRQPAALIETSSGYVSNPAAENAANLPLGSEYWLRQAAGKSKEWIEVYLMGRYGAVRAGRPVYPEYDDAVHASDEDMTPVTGSPLIIGWDFGLTPACVVTQAGPDGVFRVLNEFTAESMGIRQFSRTVVKPGLEQLYPGFDIVGAADPAGRGRAQTDERTCMDELAAAGLPAQPAPGNDFTARREAVAGLLLARLDGRPAFRLSTQCRILRKGFISGYVFERTPAAGEAVFKDRPVKNRFSHIHDALQYAAMAAVGLEKRKAGQPARRRRFAYADATAGY